MNNNVVIRAMTEKDTANVVKWRNSLAVMENFIYRTPLTEEEHLNWYYNRVKTGNVAVSNVSINLNGNIFITNSDGLITLKNVQIGDKVIFEKHGFDISDYDFCQYSDSITIDCSFSIEGRVYLTSSILNGVRVECAGMVVITDDNGYFKFNGLIGENEITLSKDNYQFDVIEISEYKELRIISCSKGRY